MTCFELLLFLVNVLNYFNLILNIFYYYFINLKVCIFLKSKSKQKFVKINCSHEYTNESFTIINEKTTVSFTFNLIHFKLLYK